MVAWPGLIVPQSLSQSGVKQKQEKSFPFPVQNKMTETDEKKVKTLSTEELQDFQETLKKTGILYMSRVPPFMKPMKVRQLLSQYGEVGRIYLAPEGNAG